MAGERIVPGQEPEIAPGVHGYTMEVDGVLWVPLIRAASRVITLLTSRLASAPLTRYLKSGEMSISAAALRIALYSCSW